MRIGRYVGLSKTFKFIALLIFICLMLIMTNLLWRWDQLIYDAYIRLMSRPPPEDIIIIAVDEESLAQLGRWPWQRHIHAELIRRLTKESARVIIFDVIFAEHDSLNPQNDVALIKAVQESGRVILPTLVELPRTGGILRETLPLPALSEAAAGLGHVHVELDADGIARSLYLMEGLGGPHWPSLSVATLRFIEPDRWSKLPGMRRDVSQPVSPLMWVRDYFVKIPFYGAPGHFQTISYEQVLKGDYPAALFKDRIILVGVTATGLGDALPTPVSGLSHSMPGVEINANVIASLRDSLMVIDVSSWWKYGLSCLLVLLPAIVYPWVRPRTAILALLIFIVMFASANILLLYQFHMWFPPAAVLVTLILSYPLWSWHRLEDAMRYMDAELALLQEQSEQVQQRLVFNPQQALEFMSQWLPVTGMALFDSNNQQRFSWGDTSQPTQNITPVNKWIKIGEESYWYRFTEGRFGGHFGITWKSDQPPDQWQTKQLYELITNFYEENEQNDPQNIYEIIQARIQQVHSAVGELGDLKRFIEDTLNQMADGVIVIDSYGQIILSNKQSRKYLNNITDRDISGSWVVPILNQIHLSGQKNWQSIFNEIFNQNKTIQIQTHIADHFDLLISASPMHLQNVNYTDAVIITMSDISELIESERRRKEVLSFLSHDLRSPLVSILALTELLEDEYANVEGKNRIKRIEKNARRTIELAEDFVQFSRVDGNEEIELKEIDLVDIASNAIDQLWEQASIKTIKIERLIECYECLMQGNAQLLERVFVNILSNSIKYSSENTTIKFSLLCEQHVARCEITDEGHGIADEELPYVFDRYKRLQHKQHAGIWGVGLGLAFVKLVVEKHNGKIDIQSQLGRGTKLTIQLPR